jgi:DNA-binding LacI/PurR family transcriptional regulator
LGVIASARLFGIPLKPSVSYVGFSANHVFQLDSLPILVVKHPLVRMARAACALMISRVHQDRTGFPASMCFEAILPRDLPAGIIGQRFIDP